MFTVTAEKLKISPSRLHGVSDNQELCYRQMAASFIQDIGQRLNVQQLCINTAIVYMQRFYAYHSLLHFHCYDISAACLFLASKVEKNPLHPDYIIGMAYKCLRKRFRKIEPKNLIKLEKELTRNENLVLQTIGFQLTIIHPHMHVIKACEMLKAPKEISKASYLLATSSLKLTTMCLLHEPTVVACFCIYLVSKWCRWEIPRSSDGKYWHYYVDKSITRELLHALYYDFNIIYSKSFPYLKSNVDSIRHLAQRANKLVKNNSCKSGNTNKKNNDSKNKMRNDISIKALPPPAPLHAQQRQGLKNSKISSDDKTSSKQQLKPSSSYHFQLHQDLISTSIINWYCIDDMASTSQAATNVKDCLSTSQHKNYYENENKITNYRISSSSLEQDMTTKALLPPAPSHALQNLELENFDIPPSDISSEKQQLQPFSNHHSQSHQNLTAGLIKNLRYTDDMPSTSSAASNLKDCMPTSQHTSSPAEHSMRTNASKVPLIQLNLLSGYKIPLKKNDPNRIMPKNTLGCLPIAHSTKKLTPYDSNNQISDVDGDVENQAINDGFHDASFNMLQCAAKGSHQITEGNKKFSQAKISSQGGSEIITEVKLQKSLLEKVMCFDRAQQWQNSSIEPHTSLLPQITSASISYSQNNEDASKPDIMTKETSKTKEVPVNKETNKYSSSIDMISMKPTDGQRLQNAQIEIIQSKQNEASFGDDGSNKHDNGLAIAGGVLKQKDDDNMRELDTNATTVVSELNIDRKTQSVNNMAKNWELLCSVPNVVPPEELLEPNSLNTNSNSEKIDSDALDRTDGSQLIMENNNHKEKDKSTVHKECKKYYINKDEDMGYDYERSISIAVTIGGDIVNSSNLHDDVKDTIDQGSENICNAATASVNVQYMYNNENNNEPTGNNNGNSDKDKDRAVSGIICDHINEPKEQDEKKKRYALESAGESKSIKTSDTTSANLQQKDVGKKDSESDSSCTSYDGFSPLWAQSTFTINILSDESASEVSNKLLTSLEEVKRSHERQLQKPDEDGKNDADRGAKYLLSKSQRDRKIKDRDNLQTQLKRRSQSITSLEEGARKRLKTQEEKENARKDEIERRKAERKKRHQEISDSKKLHVELPHASSHKNKLASVIQIVTNKEASNKEKRDAVHNEGINSISKKRNQDMDKVNKNGQKQDMNKRHSSTRSLRRSSVSKSRSRSCSYSTDRSFRPSPVRKIRDKLYTPKRGNYDGQYKQFQRVERYPHRYPLSPIRTRSSSTEPRQYSSRRRDANHSKGIDFIAKAKTQDKDKNSQKRDMEKRRARNSSRSSTSKSRSRSSSDCKRPTSSPMQNKRHLSPKKSNVNKRHVYLRRVQMYPFRYPLSPIRRRSLSTETRKSGIHRSTSKVRSLRRNRDHSPENLNNRSQPKPSLHSSCTKTSSLAKKEKKTAATNIDSYKTKPLNEGLKAKNTTQNSWLKINFNQIEKSKKNVAKEILEKQNFEKNYENELNELERVNIKTLEKLRNIMKRDNTKPTVNLINTAAKSIKSSDNNENLTSNKIKKDEKQICKEIIEVENIIAHKRLKDKKALNSSATEEKKNKDKKDQTVEAEMKELDCIKMQTLQRIRNFMNYEQSKQTKNSVATAARNMNLEQN